MASNADIEKYFEKANIKVTEIGYGMWVVNKPEDGLSSLVLSHTPPLLVYRMKLMDIPDNNQLEFFKKLLELNTEMDHGAYALEENSVVVVDTVESANLDFNELIASIEAIGFAAVQHFPILSKYHAKPN